ncbi:thioredoxin family protein [Texcoconibacillus texcoconensis]|nr:thioredoxin family protein [Texcoconibacillus texcoconensis]
MKIEILGTGCAKCKKLEARTREAITDLGLEAEVVKVEDLEDIMNYGVLSTPGFAVDGEVITTGKLLSVKDIKKHLSAK